MPRPTRKNDSGATPSNHTKLQPDAEEAFHDGSKREVSGDSLTRREAIKRSALAAHRGQRQLDDTRTPQPGGGQPRALGRPANAGR